ncbi:MAG: sulfatase-like hydrolase/transferase [Planctomycetota bacterium]
MSISPGARGARILLALATLLGCSPAPGSGPYSVLLLTLDTTRADALSCYGRYAGVTPHLDRLAAESVLYESAHTVAPLTLPAHASILTGLYPVRHGVRLNGVWALPTAAESVAETARAAGVQTAACIASLALDAAFGLDQGFEVYSAPAPVATPQTSEYPERPANEMIDAALDWLRGRDRERRFFLWVHLFDPHWPPTDPVPLSLPIPPRPREYLGEVARMDREIGRLLDALAAEDLLATTFVAVVGDHGEGLEEHGEPTHAMYCYEGTLRVPLLLRYPDGYRAGERSAENASVVDVQPTLLAAMGFTPGTGVDGVSLFRQTVPAERGVYFESYVGYLSYGWSQTAGWLDARGKYVHSSAPEFFDLAADPAEAHDLAGADPARLAAYRAAIAAVAARPALAAAAAGADLAGAIQKLGYGALGRADAAPPHPLADSGRPSPASRLEEFRRQSHAGALLNLGRFAEANEILGPIVRGNPDNVTALQEYTSGLLSAQRFAEAVPLLERLVRERPLQVISQRNLGYALRMVGRADEAVAALWRAVELDPKNEAYFAELRWMLRDRPSAVQEYAARRQALLAGR